MSWTHTCTRSDRLKSKPSCTINYGSYFKSTSHQIILWIQLVSSWAERNLAQSDNLAGMPPNSHKSERLFLSYTHQGSITARHYALYKLTTIAIWSYSHIYQTRTAWRKRVKLPCITIWVTKSVMFLLLWSPKVWETEGLCQKGGR